MKSPISGTMGAMQRASTSSLSQSSVSDTTTYHLEQRAERVRQVLTALRERAAARDVGGGAPRPLRAAIDDFGRELVALERRLRR